MKRLAPLVLLTGCATLFASGPDIVPVVTNPPGAAVYVNDKLVGKTPMQIALDRGGKPVTVRLEMAGFEPETFERSKHLNGWFVLSLLMIAAIVPPIVDIATGDWQRFDDDAIAIGLKPTGPRVLPQRPQQPPPAPPPLPPAPYVPGGTPQ